MEGKIERNQCLRCGKTQELEKHHVVPKKLAKKVGADYWNLYSSVKVDWELLPIEVIVRFQESAERWSLLPHYTQRLCSECHKQIHKEIRILDKQVRKMQLHQCDSTCDFIECEFWRQFDLGNLFSWFAPESPLLHLNQRYENNQ